MSLLYTMWLGAAWASEPAPICANLEQTQWIEVIESVTWKHLDGRPVFEVGSLKGTGPSRLGLKQGDRLVSLDGRVFRSLEDATEYGKTLIAADQFTVELVRDGAPLRLRVQLDC